MAVSGYTIPVSKLSQKVQDILEDYANGVSDSQLEIAAVISGECAADLHGAGSFKGTKYRKSWTFQPNIVTKRICSFTVYNEKHYRLTHLLEDGHKISNQYGEGLGEADAFPHIEDVEQKYIKEFEKRLKEAVQK